MADEGKPDMAENEATGGAIPTDETVDAASAVDPAETTDQQSQEQPQGDASEGQEGDQAPTENDDAIKVLEEKTEALKRSLRAVTSERSDLKRQLAEVSQPQSPETPAFPDAAAVQQEYGEDRFRDAGQWNPALMGLPYDTQDGTVCVGDPTDERSWVVPSIAEAVVSQRQTSQREVSVRTQLLQQETKSALTTVAQTLTDNAKDMRAAAMPWLSDPKDQTDADDLIADKTLQLMGQKGLTGDSFVSMDPAVMDTAAACVREAVGKVSGIWKRASRMQIDANEEAASREPIAGGAPPGAPKGKRTADMNAEEHTNYLTGIARRVFGKTGD